MAGLVGRIFLGQLAPLCPRAQNPQDSIEHRVRILPWTTTTIGTSLRSQDWFYQLPLGIAELPSSPQTLLLPTFVDAGNS
jgi:hypothetical protein